MAEIVHHRIFEHQEFPAEKNADVALNGANYALRAYVLTGPDDVFVYDSGLRPHLEYVREHLADIGYPQTAQTLVADHKDPVKSRALVLKYKGYEPSVYYFDDKWANVFGQRDPQRKADIRCRLLATETMGDKNRFARHLEASNLGHLTAHTVTFEPDEEPAYDDVRYPAHAKAAQSSNGISNELVTNEAELREFVKTIGARFVAQEHVDHIDTLSKQFIAKEGVIIDQVVTGTIVNPDKTHAGNFAPADYDPGKSTDPIAREAVRLGVEGFFGLDALITPDGRQAIVIECNPRPTGGTYAWVPAMRLGAESWTSHIMDTTLTNPYDLKLGDLAYNPQDRTGAVILSLGQMGLKRPRGSRRLVIPKVELVIFGPPNDQAEIKGEIKDRLQPPVGKKMLAKAA